MGINNINRGKKWVDARAKAVFENMTKDVEWMDSQKSIQNDVAEYTEHLNSTPAPKPETKPKKEK